MPKTNTALNRTEIAVAVAAMQNIAMQSRPTATFKTTHVMILCPTRSLIASHRIPGRRGEEFAGSTFQAQAGRVARGEASMWDEQAARCGCAGCAELRAAKVAA